MNIDQALAKFTEVCQKCDIKSEDIVVRDRLPQDIQISFKKVDRRALAKLLHEVADVVDLHGDPPDIYTLVASEDWSIGYKKTGLYND